MKRKMPLFLSFLALIQHFEPLGSVALSLISSIAAWLSRLYSFLQKPLAGAQAWQPPHQFTAKGKQDLKSWYIALESLKLEAV